jgi:hypothetical protein
MPRYASTQRPTDQKKEADQENAEGSHRRHSQMGMDGGVQDLLLLTPGSNVSTAWNASSEQECSFSAVQIGVRS